MLRIDRSSKNPRLISIFTGDICNLACILCDLNASTLWQYELGQQKKQNQIDFDIDSFDFVNVDSVTFGGGEPVLNRSTLPILKKLNYTLPILIHFNGSVLPSQEFLDECARFTDMTFIFSIDGVAEQFEILRYPAKWNKTIDNVKWLIDHCAKNTKFAVNTVVSILNNTTHEQVLDWIKINMPENTAWLLNESNGLLNRYSYKNKISEYIEFLDTLDQQRNTNWRQVFPDAALVLK